MNDTTNATPPAEAPAPVAPLAAQAPAAAPTLSESPVQSSPDATEAAVDEMLDAGSPPEGSNEPDSATIPGFFLHLAEMVGLKAIQNGAKGNYEDSELKLSEIDEGLKLLDGKGKGWLPVIPEGKTSKQKTVTNPDDHNEKYTIKVSQSVSNKVEDKSAYVAALTALDEASRAFVGTIAQTRYNVPMSSEQYQWLQTTYPGQFPVVDPSITLDDAAYESLEDDHGAAGLQWQVWLANFIERVPGKIGYSITRKAVKAK